MSDHEKNVKFMAVKLNGLTVVVKEVGLERGYESESQVAPAATPRR